MTPPKKNKAKTKALPKEATQKDIEQKPEKKKTWSLIKRMTGTYLKPHSFLLSFAICFMIWSAMMSAAFAVMIEPVIDDVLTAGNIEKVWTLATSIFLIFISRGGSTYIHSVLMNTIGQEVVKNIQNDMFSHFMNLDLKFFHHNPSGQLLSRIINDVNVMRTSVTETLTDIGKNLITLIALAGVMFYQDLYLAIAAFTIFPFAVIFVAAVGRKLRKVSGNIQNNLAFLSDNLSQVFHGIRLVKSYGMEEYEKKRISSSVDDVKNLSVKAIRIGNMTTPVNEAMVGAVVFGIIVYGGYQVAEENTTAGELMSFITAFTMSYEPMKKLAKLNNKLQMGLAAADRVFEMLDIAPDVKNKKKARVFINQTPEISLQTVEFQYEDDEKKALEGVSLKIEPGKVTALVGPSGSGKTTIMNLIPRLFDVTAGAVKIDGEDVRNFNLQSLRQNIAMVSQDITIFDDTVWANIRYGKEGAYRDEIVKAAIAAEADSFIRELPQGYDTRLGEEGVKLSGGQKQRISIARAILRDAPILLLDEATSALDNEAERAIQETLSELQKGRTTLVVAHRLSTVENADCIYVLENGRVMEKGKHKELLARKGVYSRIHGSSYKPVLSK
jgi:subfamily B ATP-binding cassette protein MsbA